MAGRTARPLAASQLVEGILNSSTHETLLVLRAQCGDREALEELLRGMQAILFRYIRRLAGDQGAGDVLQEVFLQICRNLRSLEEPRFFRAWAYRIATRASFAFLRRKHLWEERHDDSIGVDDLSASQEADAAILVAELHSLLHKLTPASRAVLDLHYLEDFTIQEVAAILQLSAGTVKSRLAYGLKSLRSATERKG
jgi:RNA polymerase sigma-70 factor, ECF subfamily